MNQVNGKDRGGRPRDERLDSAIVTATVELLEERGYNEMSLAAVAERAGTTTAAIYRRWASKAELVAHAVFNLDGDDVVADTGDIVADLSTMIHWAVAKIGRPAALAALAGVLGESREQRVRSAAGSAMAIGLVEVRLARAQADGQLRSDVDTQVLGSLIAGPVIYMLFTGNAARLDERWITGLVSVVVDGARA